MIDLKAIKSIAVVGASNNEAKTGYKIVVNLKSRGYKVYPINLKENEILGLKVYPNLAALPHKPDLVDIVVPPEIAVQIVHQAVDMKIDNIWLQPGAEFKELAQIIEKNPQINFVSQSCIMMN